MIGEAHMKRGRKPGSTNSVRLYKYTWVNREGKPCSLRTSIHPSKIAVYSNTGKEIKDYTTVYEKE